MSSDMRDDNLSECPWETGLSPRARRMGLMVFLVLFLLTILALFLVPKAISLSERRGFMSGTVTMGGQPLADARVHIRYVRRAPPDWNTRYPNVPFDPPHSPDDDHETTSDAAGSYRFSWVLPGTYDLWIQHRGDQLPWQRYNVKIEPGFQTYDIALEKRS